MRRLLLLVLAVLGATVLLAGCSDSDSGGGAAGGGAETSAVTDVPAAEFVAALEDPAVVVIDVRTPAEYAAGHVDGATNIDVDSSDFATRIAELPRDATYAVYCRSGRRSAIATAQMADAGFGSVLNLSGGVADLQAAGAPIVTG